MLLVTNIHTIGSSFCGCVGRLDHWRRAMRYVGYPACSVSNCREMAILGAPVEKYGSDDRTWYIVPLCTTHASGEVLPIRDEAPLASAVVQRSCGR
jgi:hypothetical protein